MTANAPADITMTSVARVNRLLTAARDTMVKVADCWAATPSEDGGVNVRVVGPIPGVPGEEGWTIWFATRLSSRKAADIRRSGLLTAWLSASSRPRLCCAYRQSRAHRGPIRNSTPVAREVASLLSGWSG